MIDFLFGFFNSYRDQNWIYLMITGAVFLLTGILIVLVPEILVAFIASIFFVVGFSFLYIGWKLKKSQDKAYRANINYFDL